MDMDDTQQPDAPQEQPEQTRGERSRPEEVQAEGSRAEGARPEAARGSAAPAAKRAAGGAPGRPLGRRPRRKVCSFCVEKGPPISYKDVSRLRRFVSERGKILPRRTSGNCAMHQRMLARAVKRAREIALLPFVAE